MDRLPLGTVSVSELLGYLDRDRFMTKHDAAHGYSGLGEPKLQELIRTGKLRAFRIGKKTLIRKSDLDAVILAYEVTPENRQQEKTDLQALMGKAIEQAKRNRANSQT